MLVVALGACRIGFDQVGDDGSPSLDDAGNNDGSALPDGVVPSQWTIAPIPPTSTVDLWGVWAFDPTDVWVSGATGTLSHFDGGGWTEKPNPATDTMFVVWGLVDNDVWSVGRGCTALGWDGTDWTPRTIPACGSNVNLFSIDGSATTNIWIAGTAGTVFHWNGAWVDRSAGNIDYWDIAATSATEVFLVGTRGTIAQWNGSTLSSAPLGPNLTLASIWHAGAGEYWVVGGNGTILHKTAATGWIPTSSPTTEFLYSVLGTAPDDVWAVGSNGIILHYDGTAWSIAQSPTTSSLRNLARVPNGGLRAVGDGGLVLVHP